MNVSVRRTVILLSATIFGSVGSTIIGWTATAGDPEKGKARYEQYCALCHGHRGLGNGPMAKATNPPATRLTAPEVRNKTDQEVLSFIADGKGGIMPAWRGILTDQELLDVVAYIRSLGQ